jgi:glycosyltransferase involved in cell wall biosynthesis
MTVSAPLAERFQATGYPADRIRVIQYGYDASLFRPHPETAADPTNSQRPVVVMHGSFDTHHLGPIARDALLHLHARWPDLRFRFLGKETPALLQLAQAVRAAAPGIPLEMTGFIPYHLMAEALGGASVGLVPYEESQGVHCAFVAKAVEYLGCGIPCVSTPLENLSRYFADEPAIRFSGWSGQSFAENVLAILALPATERRALGLSAAAKVAARLDWNVIATHAADFIEQQAGLPKSRCQAAGPV